MSSLPQLDAADVSARQVAAKQYPEQRERSPIFKLPHARVADLLEREANNLDLVRLICSGLVIFGHAFVIAPDSAWRAAAWDPFMQFGYPGVYSAAVAVKLFFFISGLLVTNSLLVRKSVSHYVIARVFRIWPALFVVVLATAFLIGPALTNQSLGDYFSSRLVYHYAGGNLLLHMPGELPGLFTNNPFPGLVNGALWTLPYEVAAYFAILLLAVLGCLRSRTVCALLLLFIVVDPLLPRPLLIRWIDPNPQMSFLPPCFAIGAFMAVCKDRLFISPGVLLVSGTTFWILRATPCGPLLLFLTLFLIVFYASALPWIKRLRLKADVSYGTYLWGFLVQQIIARKFHGYGLPFNLGVSLAIALLLGYLSCRFVEKPAIRLGRRLADFWTDDHVHLLSRTPASVSLMP